MRSNAEAQQTNEQIRAGARERWLEYREHAAQTNGEADLDKGAEVTPDRQKCHEIQDDDFSL
jgi:hypothetical protein